MKASYKEYDLVVGFQQVHLMPGDFIFGLKNASKELKIPIQPIRTCLEMLKTSGNITIKTTNKFSIISIVNWNTYQDQENIINKQINKPLTNKQQTTNNKQEDKNIRSKEYSGEFLSFWVAYPKKIGKDAAWNAWKKRNGSIPEISIILTAITNQKQAEGWKKDNGQFIPHPATWINQGRWMDEVKTEKAAW